jgi:hypothetical protein
MDEELISVLDLSRQLGKRKQTIFKVLKRLRIETSKQRSSNARGQQIAYVTIEESRLIAGELRAASEADHELVTEALPDEHGVFYLLVLEPSHDPGRFKVGFAVSLSERLRTLKCSTPFLQVVGRWPCKQLWEKTAIDCVTEGCEQLHTEVFRAKAIDTVVQRCQAFFKLMPKLSHQSHSRSGSEDTG